MIDRVDLPTQAVKVPGGKAEPGVANVAYRRLDARRKGIVPDLRLLQRGSDALVPVCDTIGPDDAVDPYFGFLPQEFAQEETADEPGGSGQHDVAKLVRGNRGGRGLARLPRDG